MAVTPESLTVREKAYYYVKDLILSDRLQSGQRLNQESIAKKLQISRTPIREALHRLRSEGLIEMSETGGFRVCRLSLEELEELFDIRSRLEGYLIRSACKNIPEDEIKRLSRYIRNSEKAVVAENSDDIFKWNTKFHDLLQQYAKDKQRTNNIIANMKEHMLRYRKNTLYYLDAAERSIVAHKKVLFALQLRDADLCEYLIQKHIQESKEDAIRITFNNHKNLIKTE